MAPLAAYTHEQRARRATRFAPARRTPRRQPGREPDRRARAVRTCCLVSPLCVYSQVRHFDFVNFDDPESRRKQTTCVPLTWNGLVSASLPATPPTGSPPPIGFLIWRPTVFGLRAGWHPATQCAVPRAGQPAPVRRPGTDDRSPLAQRVGGFSFRVALPACRIRGLDRGEKGCSLRIFFGF